MLVGGLKRVNSSHNQFLDIYLFVHEIKENMNIIIYTGCNL